jgi:hypothetical protein
MAAAQHLLLRLWMHVRVTSQKTLVTQSIILVADPVRVVQISQATSLILLTQMHRILQVHQPT